MPLANSICLLSASMVAAVSSAGGAAPFDVLTSLTPTLWLDGSQLTGLSGGATLTTFNDFSTNSRNFTSPNGTHLTYQIGQNGLGVVRAASGGVDISSSSSMSNFITAGEFTIWVAGKVASAPNTITVPYTSAAFIADGTGDSTMAIPVGSDNTVGAYVYSGGSHLATVSANINTFYSYIVTFKSGVLSIQVNGGTPSTTSSGNIGNLTYTPHLFCNYDKSISMAGDIGELGMCNYAINTTKSTQLESYLRSKWAHY